MLKYYHRWRNKLFRLISSALPPRLRRQVRNTVSGSLDSSPNEKIKVGFFVIYASAFPAKKLFELMLQDERFQPFIIVTPDISRDKKNMLAQLELTRSAFVDFGEHLLMGYDKATGKFIDYSGSLNFACISNPYEDMMHRVFKSTYLINQNTKAFFIHYAYSVGNFDKKFLAMPHFRKFWKIFLDHPITADEFRWEGIPTDNFEVVGYPKLDGLIKRSSKNKLKKEIILSPHHAFNYEALKFSSFHKFMEIYWRLPAKYPEVQFIFRPHPLFTTNLKNILKWKDSEVNAYINKILQNPNVSYNNQPDYMDLFSSSDALIHDCGSFMAEYLHTKKPCCYLMRDNNVFKELNFVGKKCLDLHYKAYKFEDVYDFVEKVIAHNDDGLQQLRVSEVNKFLGYNHPNSSASILERIIAEK